MIRYALRCAKEHEFEAWFRSSSDYDRSAEAGEVLCPVCGSSKVEKALMAPALGSGRAVAPRAPDAQPEPDKVKLATADPREKALREAFRELRKKVTEHADYVGEKFADEARKIHYEETEPRGIYGEATPDEAKSLHDEGIEFHPLPPLPEDKN
ncbi:DUF1178 family protein [Bauldia sp.]|uniref:DUF1178 family protein n=1 Tax=Bauldia sp. TaxID=2575872 RepID=UPI003BA999B3